MRPLFSDRTPLSPVDTAWLRMEDPTNLMMITGVFLFESVLDFETVKNTLTQKLLRFRRFRQRVIQPRISWLPPYWEDDPHFNLDSHIRRIALPEPGNKEILEYLVNDFMSTPLDLSKPLWQFHLVENYGDGCALLCRLHHCIADGIALMRVMLSLTDEDPVQATTSQLSPIEIDESGRDDSEGSRDSNGSRATRRRNKRFLKKSLVRLSNPAKAYETIKLGVESSTAFAHLLLLSKDPPTPFKGKLGVMKRCTWTQPIPLDDVKAIGRVTGATVNDVLLTAVSGALGRYLRTRGESIGGLNFRAVIPVNLRPPDEPLKLGNAFGLVFLSLPVSVDDPLNRLHELKTRMDGIKGTPEALVAFGILNAIGITTTEIEEIVVKIFGTKATAVMTNVPGPREVRYFAGQPIRQLMFWVPQSGRLGLGVSILSYAGEVLVGVATDAGLVPDPESIIEAIHTEIADLMLLVEYAREADQELERKSEEKARCTAKTKSGNRCKNTALQDSDYCHIHTQSLIKY